MSGLNIFKRVCHYCRTWYSRVERSWAMVTLLVVWVHSHNWICWNTHLTLIENFLLRSLCLKFLPCYLPWKAFCLIEDIMKGFELSDCALFCSQNDGIVGGRFSGVERDCCSSCVTYEAADLMMYKWLCLGRLIRGRWKRIGPRSNTSVTANINFGSDWMDERNYESHILIDPLTASAEPLSLGAMMSLS